MRDAFRAWMVQDRTHAARERTPSGEDLIQRALFAAFSGGCEEGLRAIERARDALTALPDSNRQRMARQTTCAAALELCVAGRIRPPSWALEFCPDPEEFANRRRFGGTGEEW